jgi:hypothetical protein
MASKSYTRRKRRTERQVLKHGKKAKRKHCRVGGRTGHLFTKRLMAGPSRGLPCSRSSEGPAASCFPVVRLLLRGST